MPLIGRLADTLGEDPQGLSLHSQIILKILRHLIFKITF